MDEIQDMKTTKTMIDRLEKELIIQWEDEAARVVIQKQLDDLWTEYEAMLEDAWRKIDPSIFE